MIRWLKHLCLTPFALVYLAAWWLVLSPADRGWVRAVMGVLYND